MDASVLKLRGRLPNFRVLPNTLMCRSGRPDKLSQDSVQDLVNGGIRSLIDLRGAEIKKKTRRFIAEYYPLEPIQSHKSHDQLTPTTSKASPHASDGIDNQQPQCNDEKDKVPPKRATYGFNLTPQTEKQFTDEVDLGLPWYMRLLLAILVIINQSMYIRVMVLYQVQMRGLTWQYQQVMKYCGQAIADALHVMSKRECLPALVYCAYGKDRTGVLVALALSCLGWSHDQIADDYAISQIEMNYRQARSPPVERWIRNRLVLSNAPRDSMVQLLSWIDATYGSVESYLEGVGFTRDQQQLLRENMVHSAL